MTSFDDVVLIEFFLFYLVFESFAISSLCSDDLSLNIKSSLFSFPSQTIHLHGNAEALLISNFILALFTTSSKSGSSSGIEHMIRYSLAAPNFGFFSTQLFMALCCELFGMF